MPPPTRSDRNVSPFPAIATYPAIPHLSFNGEFAAPEFTALLPDSPWVYFDAAANTFRSERFSLSGDRHLPGDPAPELQRGIRRTRVYRAAPRQPLGIFRCRRQHVQIGTFLPFRRSPLTRRSRT